MSQAIFCSFFSDDEYYRMHGLELRENLESLGAEFVVEEIHKEPDQDWIDICRKKVPFLHRVCQDNPSKKVFWMDVDCRLLEIPEFIVNSTADIVGFQRGFSQAMSIGYRNRSRFWEPCFWGVGTSYSARKMISDAYESESTLAIKATDDYFFEEGWRANANNLTFQVIPSACVVGKRSAQTIHTAFFAFGTSGNVEMYKGMAAQHEKNTQKDSSMRKKLVTLGKKVLNVLPNKVSKRLISFSDHSGITELILGKERSLINEMPLTTGQGLKSPDAGQSESTSNNSEQKPKGRSLKQRRKILSWIVASGIKGNTEKMEEMIEDITSDSISRHEENATIDAARSFAYYSDYASDREILLAWWSRPFPGNFGDWLSPLIFNHYSDAKVAYLSPLAKSAKTQHHLFGVGSIGRFIKDKSIVVGTGISSHDHLINGKADFISVRGPITAAFLEECGGPVVKSFGDPAAVMSRIFPIERKETNGKKALVRHFTHERIPLTLSNNMEELNVMLSNPDSIKEFVTKLNTFDEVITSAMHVFIVCQSYGIPCSLITFKGLEHTVHGTGIKYSDYALGVGLAELEPIPVDLDLTEVSFQNIRREDAISETKKDEIEAAILEGIDLFQGS